MLSVVAFFIALCAQADAWTCSADGCSSLLAHGQRTHRVGRSGVSRAHGRRDDDISRASALRCCYDPRFDWRADPPWQRDCILLLAYVGSATLVRSAATGVKSQLGFDLVQLNGAMGSALFVGGCWLGVAALTGVLAGERYDAARVVATWTLAAPAAAYLRVTLLGDAPFQTDGDVTADVAATLLLMLGLRSAEQTGYL